MSARSVRPPWWLRVIGNRVAPVLGRSVVSRLRVAGRRSGVVRTVPVVVLDHEGGRFLVSAFGRTAWAHNLAAAGAAQLVERGRSRAITVEEVPPADRPPVLAAYLERHGSAPGVRRAFDQLPDPGDHPTFRIIDAPDRER